jgi:hypothetical protein
LAPMDLLPSSGIAKAMPLGSTLFLSGRSNL